MFSGSTDNSTHYNSSTIKALLNRTGRLKNYFGESNTYKHRSRSRSISVSKTREEQKSRSVSPEKITDAIKQDSKKKGVFIPWSNYAAFMGFSNNNNKNLKEKDTYKCSSIDTLESKKDSDGDKWPVKNPETRKHKLRQKLTTKSSKPRRSSITSIDSTTDLNKKINAQQRNHKKDRKTRRDKHIKEKHELDYQKTSVTSVKYEASNKSLQITTILKRSSLSSKHKLSSSSSLIKTEERYSSRILKKSPTSSRVSLKESSSKLLYKAKKHKTSVLKKSSNTSVKKKISKPSAPKKTVHKEKIKSSKSPTRSLASQNKTKDMLNCSTSHASVAIAEETVNNAAVLPTKNRISKKRCKGECVGKGRIVYTEKGNEPIEETPPPPPLNTNCRKHMSIFNLDKYLMVDKLADSSSEVCKNFESADIIIDSPISDDKLARQKLSAHKNEKSWSKTEDEPINDTRSKNSIFNECTPVVAVINCDPKSETFYISKTITELMLKVNVMKEVIPEDSTSRSIQEKNINCILKTVEILKEVLKQKTICEVNELELGSTKDLHINATDRILDTDVTNLLNKSESLCNYDCEFTKTKSNEGFLETNDVPETPIKISRDPKQKECEDELNIYLKNETGGEIITAEAFNQPKIRSSKKKSHRRKTFTKKRTPIHSTSCEGGLKCRHDIGNPYQVQKDKLISFTKCRSTSSNNFIIRHVVKSQQFDNIKGDDDIIIPKKEISEDSLKKNSSSLINPGVRCETIYDTEMTEDSLIHESGKMTQKVRNKRRRVNKNANTATDSDENITPVDETKKLYTGEAQILIENCETLPASTTIDENSTTRSKKSENCIINGKEKIENGEIETEKISEEETEMETVAEREEKGKHETQLVIKEDVPTTIENLSSCKVEADLENVQITDKFSFTQAHSPVSKLVHLCENINNLVIVEQIQIKDAIEDAEINLPEVDKNIDWCESFEKEFGLQTNIVKSDVTVKTKPNGVYYFPSITIYNKNYVNSIGDWMKNDKLDNSSDEKLWRVNSPESLENDVTLSSFYNNNNIEHTDRNCLTIKKTKPEQKKTFRIDTEKTKEKEMNFINISVDCNNYACQKIINNFKFSEKSSEEDKDNKKRESRIPVLIPSTIRKNKKSLWKEFYDIDLKKKKLCTVCSREFLKPKCVMKMQSVQTNIIPQQSDMSTLVSLCSLENDSTTLTTDRKYVKHKKPKYHLISRAYCTVDDCINIGQNKLQTLPIKTESYTIESVKFNSKGLIDTKTKDASTTSSTSTMQTNTSCIDRIQALMSSMNNKKCEKPKKGLWRSFKLSLRKKDNSRGDFERPQKSTTKNITFLKRPKNDQKEQVHETNDVELLQSGNTFLANKSLHTTSYQTLFSKDTEITDISSSNIEVLYPANQIEEPHDSETFTICAPNSRFGLYSRPRSMESFFKPHKDVWRTKSACVDCNQLSEHCCATMKKTCSSNLLLKNQKLQECYHYCKCGQLLKIEIIKNLKCRVK